MWPRRALRSADDAGGVDERLVRAAYAALLRREPDPDGLREYLAALRRGMPWADVLRSIVSSDEFAEVHAERSALERMGGSYAGDDSPLVRLRADVTVTLEACRPLAGPLRLSGPVRDSSVFSSILEGGGIWEPEVTRVVCAALLGSDTFLDVGANIGYFTVLGAARVGPQGRVYGFEPVPDLRGYCAENARLNRLRNVTVLPYALWDAPATREIAVPESFLGGAHVVPDGAPPSARRRTEPISCARLDDLVDGGAVDVSRLRLVKMDIEGAEPFALAGMARTLETRRPAVVAEVNTSCLEVYGLRAGAVLGPLRELGYRLGAIDADAPELADLPRLDHRFGDDVTLREIPGDEELEERLSRLDGRHPPAFPLEVVAVPVAARGVRGG